MISFDDYGGSGGDVDLSPIYLSLGILKTNTQMIYDSLTNMTGTITLSTPYLETYRTQNEVYMYNITGDLTGFSDTNKFVNGFINNIVSNSFYAVFMNIDFISRMSFCTFPAAISNPNRVSLHGQWMDYNSFENNGLVKIDANILAHNTFSNVRSAYITAMNLHVIEDDKFNGFDNLQYLDITCHTIRKGMFYVSTLSLKCREFINGVIFSGIDAKVEAQKASEMLLINLQNVNFTANSVNNFGAANLEMFNFTCNKLDIGNLSTITLLNMTCCDLENNTIQNIQNAKLNGYSLKSCNFWDIPTLELNYNTIESLALNNVDLSIKCVSANHASFDRVGFSDSVLASGNIIHNSQCSGYQASLYLTGKEMSNCTWNQLQKGHMSYDDMDNCSFYSCHDMSVYAGTLKNVLFSECTNITIYGDLMSVPSLLKCSNIGLLYPEISTHYLPRIESCTNLSLSNLHRAILATGGFYRLDNPDNWDGQLYIKENPLSFGQSGSDISDWGIRFVSTSSSGAIDSAIKLQYAIWHTGN